VQPLAEYKKMNAHLGRLPQMRDEIKELRAEVEKLRKRLAEE
jgi:ubiquinone biosynthesis protein UbiJ